MSNRRRLIGWISERVKVVVRLGRKFEPDCKGLKYQAKDTKGAPESLNAQPCDLRNHRGTRRKDGVWIGPDLCVGGVGRRNYFYCPISLILKFTMSFPGGIPGRCFVPILQKRGD